MLRWGSNLSILDLSRNASVMSTRLEHISLLSLVLALVATLETSVVESDVT